MEKRVETPLRKEEGGGRWILQGVAPGDVDLRPLRRADLYLTGGGEAATPPPLGTLRSRWRWKREDAGRQAPEEIPWRGESPLVDGPAPPVDPQPRQGPAASLAGRPRVRGATKGPTPPALRFALALIHPLDPTNPTPHVDREPS